MSEKTNTPETDAKEEIDQEDGFRFVPSSLSRKLETERDKAVEHNKYMLALARGNGFESLSDAITIAKNSRLLPPSGPEFEECDDLKIDLRKLREINLSLANENHEMQKELVRLNSPFWSAREASMVEIFNEAQENDTRAKNKSSEGDQIVGSVRKLEIRPLEKSTEITAVHDSAPPSDPQREGSETAEFKLLCKGCNRVFGRQGMKNHKAATSCKGTASERLPDAEALSDTQETDSELIIIDETCDVGDEFEELAKFARKIERQRNEARAKLTAAREALERIKDATDYLDLHKLRGAGFHAAAESLKIIKELSIQTLTQLDDHE